MYPSSYDSNMDCEYKIITGLEMQIVLKLETVSLKRRNPSIGIVEDIAKNENYDDTLTIFDVDPFNKTSNIYIFTILSI